MTGPVCDHCGAQTCAVWMAPDDLWQDFNGRSDGVACPDCFFSWAVRSGVAVRFVVERIVAP